MNELVTLMGNEPTTTSLKVAKYFHKRHDRVLRAIENASMTHPKNGVSESPFRKSHYIDESGKKNLMYNLTRDGFSFVVMGFTGKEAAEWKWKFIAAFNEMERIIRERLTLEWQNTRAAGKLTRKAETNVLKMLVQYAEEQGSTNSDKLYVIYTRLANKAVGIKSRDTANIRELNRLDEAEDMILRIIRRDMAKDVFYKDIYQNCKRHLDAWQSILRLT